MLHIAVHDESHVNVAVKTISEAYPNHSVMEDGQTIKFIAPKVTQELRTSMIKTIKQKAEACKITLRSSRQDVMNSLKKEMKSMSKDESDRLEKQVINCVYYDVFSIRYLKYRTTIRNQFKMHLQRRKKNCKILSCTNFYILIYIIQFLEIFYNFGCRPASCRVFLGINLNWSFDYWNSNI